MISQPQARAELITRQGEAESGCCNVTLMIEAQIAHQADPVVHIESRREARAVQTKWRATDHQYSRACNYSRRIFQLVLWLAEPLRSPVPVRRPRRLKRNKPMEKVKNRRLRRIDFLPV